MTVEFLKDVSLVLSLVSAARDNNFDLHLQAEKQMIPLTGAYDHYHYTRYLTYQHVLYSNLKHESSPEYRNLATKCFAASYSGDAFTSVHGDLVTEYLNREMKGTAGPFRSGFSTNDQKKQKLVNTMQNHAKIRQQ